MSKGHDYPPLSAEANAYLRQRAGRLHLWQRQGIQRDHVTQIFGRGRNFFHIENWYSVHSVMRSLLRAVGLYERGRRNAAAICIRHHEVRLPHLPRPFDGYRILHLSDLHLDIDPAIHQAIAERVAEVRYDLCVITGDFRARTYGDDADALRAMTELRRRISQPIYAVLGNHDFIEMVPALEALEIRVLLNEAATIARDGERIHLAGVDDAHYYQADNLEKAADAIPIDELAILLSHSPEIYRHAAHAGFDLMLCGHTHGGQICLPGGVPITYHAR